MAKQFDLFDENSEITKQVKKLDLADIKPNDFIKALAKDGNLENYEKAYRDFLYYADKKVASLPNDRAVSIKYHFKKEGYAEDLFILICLYAINKGFDVVEADNKTVTIKDTFTHVVDEMIMFNEAKKAGIPVTIIY